MSHIPYGYTIENGKPVIDNEKAIKIRTMFSLYLAGASLIDSAKQAGIYMNHASVAHILTNKKYTGDGYYPAMIEENILKEAIEERVHRAEKLGRTERRNKVSSNRIPMKFTIKKSNTVFDDPFKQAAYTYSLIESEDDLKWQ